jgi:enoyl-CoA hydratase
LTVTLENIRVARDGPVETITVDRPKALNALNPATIEELLSCCEELRKDPTVRCAIVTGSGDRAFVAGADIAAMETLSALQARAFARRGQRLMRSLEALSIPVIAAVNGFALGGGLELAMACDIVLASDTAKFGQPEINLGIIPGFGGTQRLARRIGAPAARMLIYSGEMITADEALRLGLVNRVVPAADLLPEARTVAAALAGKAPVALEQAKAAINLGLDVGLEDGCRYEAEAFAVAFGSADRAEGMRAFLEKRRPVFKGS